MNAKIYLDSREKEKFTKLAQEYWKGRVIIEELDVGDLVSGNVCIERKTVSDFVNSHNKGRLHNQILNMKANFDIPLLCVSGTEWEVKNYTGWTVPQFNARLMGISLDYDIKVLRADTDYGLLSQANSAFKRGNNNVDYVETGVRKISQRTGHEYVDMICVVDRIGPKKAREILKSFKVYELWDISEKDLRDSVKGIGKKQAADIKKVFCRR